MAKARKQKGEEHKTASAEPKVLHQKLCLSIDMESQKLQGYTELKISLPVGEHIGLHADQLSIQKILVDGEPVEFKYSYMQDFDDGTSTSTRWSSVTCCQKAADVACSTYVSILNNELSANLLVMVPKLLNEQQSQESGGHTAQSLSEGQLVNGGNEHEKEKAQNVRLVHIDYTIEKPETGVHFMGNVMHTHNQLSRARCWFPCIDNAGQRCTYDLEFAVDSTYVAVSNGDLLFQGPSRDNPSKKSYIYSLSTPVCPQYVALVVAPFQVLPDSSKSAISHMCLSAYFSKLQNTVSFFHTAYSYYEEYLSYSFPFGSYRQIFLPSESTITSTILGASSCIFSSEVLYDESIIDQTIKTRIKFAYALAKQWFGVYITAEEPTDEWLLDGFSGFLTEKYIKRFFGNNEACYRRFKANCAVIRGDISGATTLSSCSGRNLYGTQTIGLHGKIRALKAVAILQMLEKQMGPDSFQKVMQTIVSRASASNFVISTREFRQLANKIGNVERPFLKDFFPQWVEGAGCPSLRLAFSYNRKKNLIELAVHRASTTSASEANPVSDNRVDLGWPGMMSVRVHETDGMSYDHPVLPMAGESLQLVEIQCRSKPQKLKKFLKPDSVDDMVDAPVQENRPSMDSPLLWIRVDPEMEYLSEIHLHQPIQMWIKQLEKDKDVIAQSQAIAMLEKLPQPTYSVVNALTNFLHDSEAFWRVRIEAAYALAVTASEDTAFTGLLNLLKFYRSRRYDADTNLPRPNDFHDLAEYFVLEAIPHAVSFARAADKRSPREAIEFVLQLLKYNDNSGNTYSDVYWLSAMVQACGELELGHQCALLLPAVLKLIDRSLQLDCFMPSYNRVLTRSCIQALAQIALKMTDMIHLDGVLNLLKPFRSMEKPWVIRHEASRVLLDLEFHYKGVDGAISLFLEFLKEEKSLRGETKLAAHVVQLFQEHVDPKIDAHISCATLVNLLCALASKKAFNNIFLRHHLFCIMQVAAGRPPTLYGISKELIPLTILSETSSDQFAKADSLQLNLEETQEHLAEEVNDLVALPTAEITKEVDDISNGSEKKSYIVKIKVKRAASSSKADDGPPMNHSHAGGHVENEVGPCSSVSVDAPPRKGNQNIEEVSSCHDRESRMDTSNWSGKIGGQLDNSKELQCTADSRLLDPVGVQLSQVGDAAERVNGRDILDPSTACREGNVDQLSIHTHEAKDRRKKDKEKKRKREDKSKDDPEYLERRRQKKEKRRMEKELAKLHDKVDNLSTSELPTTRSAEELQQTSNSAETRSLLPVALRIVNQETTADASSASLAPKLKIKIKRSISEMTR